ncbi:MAG: CRISPR-associated endonuclease Cas3'' [Deltaproteobacteria bacterium]|nr:CRISPR-associated endonuclease Cas3'' [Deltaproteobacteria bacterium]
MTETFYAHSKDGEPPDRWQPLEDHLSRVAELAQSFADDFGAGDWGRLAGLWHDLGKYSKEFQTYILSCSDPDAHIEAKPGRVDHSTAGAQHSFGKSKNEGKILAYAIAGHHAGLLNGKDNEGSCLAARLEKTIPSCDACPDWLLRLPILKGLPFPLDKSRFCFQFSFFIRMIYSCLVDADFLDTERFMDEEKSRWRQGYPSLETLHAKLKPHLEQLTAKASPTPINGHRADILKHCIDAADQQPGLFSLTVPTGGGKTLSSLAFAMKHALRFGKKRIIYVIPYTSIIEQNTAVFRAILGEDAVLEHHSNFDPEEEDHRSRLAAENWDAPLVVTTNVQFFESLFACRSSRCRKIHRITDSVVILDEAQMLPVPLLKPSIEVLRELALNYRTTIVLCTATQPVLSTSDSFKDGLEGVREIIPDPAMLYRVFKRVQTVKLPLLSDADLASSLGEHRQVLCVVNTRKHARLLYERLPDREGCHHLSALMCPAHRTEALDRIRAALANGDPCRVISTQLVEAGVDIDFPVVFRSIAGVDSISQAAGRCNREGKLSGNGQVFVFTPEAGLPPGYFRQTAETAEAVLRHHEDPLSLEAVRAYFEQLYWLKGAALDQHQILADLAEGAKTGDFPFRVVAEKFKIIEEGMAPIIIPWNGDAERIVEELRYSAFPAAAARKAQRFTIQLYPQILYALLKAGSVERLHEQYNVLINRDLYREDLGLCPEDPTFHKIGSLMI